jgi:hypothetical protein
MKTIKISLVILLIIFSTVLLQRFFPWWITCVVCFLLGLFLINRTYTAFITCFFTSGLSWIALAYFKDYNADVSIAVLVSGIFNNIGALPIYLITGLSIAFVSGFAGWSGNLLGHILFPNTKKSSSIKSKFINR